MNVCLLLTQKRQTPAKEHRPAEARVAATPETVRKHKALGLTVAMEAAPAARR